MRMVFTFFILLAPYFNLHAVSQAATQPALQDAMQQLQKGDAAAAVNLLKRFTEVDPRSADAWRALGKAYQQLHKDDDAIEAYQRALQIEPDAPKVFFAMGIAYAAKRDTESAFKWFRRARDSGRYDMTQLSIEKDVAGLRQDARFAALLPSAAQFEHPFVEPVAIVHEWRGEASNDQFGWIARNIGDVDGDGVNDVVISAPTHGSKESRAGRIYVYSTRTGKHLWHADGRAGDQLGIGVESAGDTNNDGIPDVVASGPAGSGVAYVYSGTDGRILHSFSSNNPDELFGSHVSGAGDVNQDGFADILIGAPGKEDENKIAGHVYIYSGKDGALLRTLDGERIGDEYGSTVAGYSDAKGQGYVVVGAPRAGARHHGRVYVYDRISAKPKFIIEADGSGMALGAMFVSVVGDIDGDGFDDIYASDWSNSAKGLSTGRIFVHSGKTGKRVLTLTGESAGDGFGTSASVAGDVDGDGHADLIVGAWQYGKTAVSGGRVYLYSGNDGRLLQTYTDHIPGDTLGFDAVGVGDVDQDGDVDLLLTAAWSGVNGYHSGRVFVVSSGIQRPAKPKK